MYGTYGPMERQLGWQDSEQCEWQEDLGVSMRGLQDLPRDPTDTATLGVPH
jgi:hypothetical protein